MAILSRGQGASHIVLPCKSHVAAESKAKKIAGGEFQVSRSLMALESDLIRYFLGRYVDFSKYSLDFTYSTGFQKSVWFAVKGIPFGKTLTYKDVAESLGNPKLARAVGNALNKNPLPILIPCHRVIAEDGFGGYVGGKTLKKKILALEGVKPLNK
jgi:methylated-DNA-[protein]-cysteine S-methyltransferase